MFSDVFLKESSEVLYLINAGSSFHRHGETDSKDLKPSCTLKCDFDWKFNVPGTVEMSVGSLFVFKGVGV